MDNKSANRKTIVFFSIDALGHIHPILSIVSELCRRGHRALILTIDPLASGKRLQDMGYELDHCFDKPADSPKEEQSEEKVLKMVKDLADNFRKGLPHSYEATYEYNGAVGKYFQDVVAKYKFIETKLAKLKPDLIVADHVVGIPCITKYPWVRVYSGFPTITYSARNDNFNAGLGLKLDEMSPEWKKFEHKVKDPIRKKLRDFFNEKGVPDWPEELELCPSSPLLNFFLGPKELGFDNVSFLKPLPETWFRLEHTIDGSKHLASDEIEFNTPDSLKNSPGKLIYFSLGTLVTGDVDLINRLLGMLSKSQNKFIVSMGQMNKHINLYPNMYGERFINQNAVLAKADLFITHGGHNSIIEAFYHGVPGLIVLPVFADQFDSGQRVEDCGFGVRLNPFNCTQDELLNSIDLLLNNSQLKERIQIISKRLKSIRYHEIAADKLEELI